MASEYASFVMGFAMTSLGSAAGSGVGVDSGSDGARGDCGGFSRSRSTSTGPRICGRGSGTAARNGYE